MTPAATCSPPRSRTIRVASTGTTNSPISAPGTYRIVEDDQNLPAGTTDANVIMVGTVNGVVDGMSGNDAQGNDFITNIRLQAGDMGMMYCFLENCNVTPPPAQISGFVNCIEMGGQGINGVTVRLFDAAGNLLATAVTHTQNGLDGYYEFANLGPGTYRVVEDDSTLPAGDTDANQFTVGTVNGVINGMGGQTLRATISSRTFVWLPATRA